MEAVDEHARKVRRRAKVSQSDIGGGEPADGQGIQDELAVLYGMAENEALGDLCDVLDEVSVTHLRVSRHLSDKLAAHRRGTYPVRNKDICGGVRSELLRAFLESL